MVPAHLTAGRLQIAEDGSGRAEASQSVDDNAHLDTGTRAFGQRFDDFAGDLAFEKFIELQIDGAAGFADRGQLFRIKGGTVGEGTNARAADLRIGDQAQELQELVGLDGVSGALLHGVRQRWPKEIDEHTRAIDRQSACADRRQRPRARMRAVSTG